MGYWGYRPKPKHVRNGMELQSLKSGGKWWSEKFMLSIESFMQENSAYRGIVYARQGQVFDFKVDSGVIAARVQCTRLRPFSVKITLPPIPADKWKKITAELESKLLTIAYLVSGEMPKEVEAIFKSAGANIFPEYISEFKVECSCPDRIKPCKHVLAVFFVLAEEMDRDPLIVFRLRGKTKQELLSCIYAAGNRRPEDSGKTGAEKPAGAEDKVEAPLEELTGNFWKPAGKFRSIKIGLSPAKVEMAILRRLGAPQFCANDKRFWSLMKRVYGTVSAGAAAAAQKDSCCEAVKEPGEEVT